MLVRASVTIGDERCVRSHDIKESGTILRIRFAGLSTTNPNLLVYLFMRFGECLIKK